MKYRVRFGEEERRVEAHREGEEVVVTLDEQTFRFRADTLGNALQIHPVTQKGAQYLFSVAGRPLPIHIEDPRDYTIANLNGGVAARELRASIPGRILKVHIAPGAEVKKGQALLILEAMKMENELKATHDVTVEAVHVKEGQTVENNALLLTFKA